MLHNTIILGSGRSGTSMLAGMLRKCGHYQGDNYLQSRAANPKGFFEDREVNTINETILRSTIQPWKFPRTWLANRHLPRGGMWLASLPTSVVCKAPASVRNRIQERVAKNPFCYKDPRFAYTLGAWRPYLPSDTKVVVVFRDPRKTIDSLIRETAEDRVLAGCALLDANRAANLWMYVYRYILHRSDIGFAMYFVDAGEILNGKAVPSLEKFLGCELERGFAEPALSRSSEDAVELSPAISNLYEELLMRSDRSRRANQ